jgi:hypoxanthine phosphoribosyltransferase
MFKHQVLITEDEIQQRVKELADRLNEDYSGNSLDVICVLKGAMFFVADLARKLTMPVRIHFLHVTTYGSSTEATGTVNLHFSSVSEDLVNRNVLLIEDILDTGITLDYLLKQLKEENPFTLRTCVLLDKPSRRKVDVQADYVGFVIDDNFVIGYGLDYQELGRNLTYIAVLDPAEYAAYALT